MTTRTGLDAQVGYALETTVGTGVTVTKFSEFNSESISADFGYIEPDSLRVGQKFKSSNRLVQSRKMAAGSLSLPYSSRLMGTLWKACIGSTVTTPTVSGSGWKQVHQTGDLLGKSLTVQVGRPLTESSSVQAFTYRGAKVTGWELAFSEGDVGRWNLELDAWDEDTATALTAASFIAGAAPFSFLDISALTLGGTLSGTTELALSGGTAFTSLVKGISIKGDNALDTERYGAGGAGTKREQYEGGIPSITMTFDCEFGSLAEYHTRFTANTATALRLLAEGAVIGAGPEKNTLEIIAANIRFKKSNPVVSGPETVKASVEAEVYQNSTGDNPFQVKIISGDSAAI